MGPSKAINAAAVLRGERYLYVRYEVILVSFDTQILLETRETKVFDLHASG